MRSTINFNDDWLFAPQPLNHNAPDSDFVPVTLPHTNRILPHHNFDNAEYEFISTYRKYFKLPEPQAGRRVFIDFDGAMLVSTVYLNGHQVGVHAGGYTPFTYDLTDYLTAGENVLTVHVDSTERPDVPPYGYVVDYMTFGGIYRDVHLRLVEPTYIQDIFVRPSAVLESTQTIHTDVSMRNRSKTAFHGQVMVTITAPDSDESTETTLSVDVPAQGETTLTATMEGQWPLWSLDAPHLCRYEVTVTSHDTLLDEVSGHFGLREAEFRDDGGFYLNGEHINLFGLNRHQNYPYIGAAAPARLQQQDADILKYELGCNIVRTSHYPQSPHFLNRCDEIGLLVFEEIPGWQHIGDDDWQALSLRDVRAMIERDRNHPSIIVWGVRINESMDNDAFYARTNALARELDPTRPTSGVRYFQYSNFLEDVFGFNDFSKGVEEPQNVPHLITEFNGHMFPTKTWDNEERLIEHAVRHAAIQNQQMGMANVSGAIGWCAFDYNTHREFGSGDRICYHGVMDIFRLPKWAAAFYASQQSPEQRIILQAATFWTMGDRAEGGNDPIVVFSNCDEIQVFFGETELGRFQPDRETYPHLPHPPFTVRGLNQMMMWGQSFGTLKIIGFLGGEAVIEQRIAPDGVPQKLVLWADFPTLNADGADMTRVAFQITDEFGNPLPYANQPITLTAEGPGELIGENPFPLMGGQGAVYLKAGHTPGEVTITAKTPRLDPQTVKITLQ